MAEMEYYPPVGFYFSVEFSGVSNKNDSKFQEVSGISVSVETEPFKQGGSDNTYDLPKKMKYTNLVLKRGMLMGSQLTTWFRKATENLEFSLMDIQVSLMNREGQPLAVWSFVNCYPIKWSVDAFNSTKNEVALETMEISYEYFTRLQ